METLKLFPTEAILKLKINSLTISLKNLIFRKILRQRILKVPAVQIPARFGSLSSRSLTSLCSDHTERPLRFTFRIVAFASYRILNAHCSPTAIQNFKFLILILHFSFYTFNLAKRYGVSNF